MEKSELLQEAYATQMELGGHEHRTFEEYLLQQRSSITGTDAFRAALESISEKNKFADHLFAGSECREVAHPQNHIALVRQRSPSMREAVLELEAASDMGGGFLQEEKPFVFEVSSDIQQAQIEVYLYILLALEAIEYYQDLPPAKVIEGLIERFESVCRTKSEGKTPSVDENTARAWKIYTESVVKILRNTTGVVESAGQGLRC